jgi:hypothetical protein
LPRALGSRPRRSSSRLDSAAFHRAAAKPPHMANRTIAAERKPGKTPVGTPLKTNDQMF